MLRKATGVGITGAALTVLLSGPAWAGPVHAGEFCAKKAVGSYTMDAHGGRLVCSWGGASDPYNRWHHIGSPAPMPAHRHHGQHMLAPRMVNTGSGGAADHTRTTTLPLVAGGTGIVLLGTSLGAVARRRRAAA